VLIELVAMRMCGHAHHDDMLYLGKDPQPSWSYPSLTEGGYANRDLWDYWCRKDPIETYATRLAADGVIGSGDLEKWKREAEELVEREARAVIEAPWPDAALAAVMWLRGKSVACALKFWMRASEGAPPRSAAPH